MEITTICGIDFSGAAKAGRKIWIAEAAIEANRLRINRCTRACDLVGSTRDRARCLPVLREFIGRPGSFAYGVDFPFGLPAALVQQSNWQEFVLNFGEEFPSELEFRDLLHAKACAKELKRITDIQARTPFSPYNLRLFRQTYYGIRDVLAPLVAADRIRVLPMQEPTLGYPVVLEVCPASTLERLGLKQSYKHADLAQVRVQILHELMRRTSTFCPGHVERQVAEDREGDALDSAIAAIATYRALEQHEDRPSPSETSLLEGFVYV